MAKVTIVSDDFDASVTENVETVFFVVDGKFWEIDLGDKNRKAFYAAMSKYTKAGRESTRVRVLANLTAGGNANGTVSETAAIRAWAKANGHEVGEKGRLSPDIVKAYNDAQAK